MSEPLHVLIVEDSSDDAGLLVRHLKRAGYDVVWERVDTPEQLHSALAKQTWDLVTSDFAMPSFGGREALDIVRSKDRELPFILISGTIGEEAAVEVMKAGAHDYLLKDRLARLGAAVTRELAEAEVRRQKRRAEDAVRFLLHASIKLSETLDYAATVSAAARLSIPFLSDWCTVELRGEEGVLERAASAHQDKAKEELLARAPSAVVGALGEEARAAVEAVLEGAGPRLVRVAGGAPGSAAWAELGVDALLVVALVARGQAFGVLLLGSASPARVLNVADLSLAQDLAQRAALAIDNARLYRETREQLKARDDFLSIASHELRTPLTPLQLGIDRLLRTARAEDGQAISGNVLRGLEQSQSYVRRIAALVDDLLEVVRLLSAPKDIAHELFDLSELVRQTVGEFSEQLRAAGSPLELRIHGEVWGVFDRARLKRALVHLLSNAVKFGAGAPVEVDVGLEDGRAHLEIRDHGLGIAAEDQRRIFERFERAVSIRHYGGFGLGLWIVRQIVEAHHGTVHVASHPGAGAVFTIELPLNERSSATPRASAPLLRSG